MFENFPFERTLNVVFVILGILSFSLSLVLHSLRLTQKTASRESSREESRTDSLSPQQVSQRSEFNKVSNYVHPSSFYPFAYLTAKEASVAWKEKDVEFTRKFRPGAKTKTQGLKLVLRDGTPMSNRKCLTEFEAFSEFGLQQSGTMFSITLKPTPEMDELKNIQIQTMEKWISGMTRELKRHFPATREVQITKNQDINLMCSTSTAFGLLTWEEKKDDNKYEMQNIPLHQPGRYGVSMCDDSVLFQTDASDEGTVFASIVTHVHRLVYNVEKDNQPFSRLYSISGFTVSK